MRTRMRVAATIGSISIVCVMFYLLNYYTPLFADDYSYAYNFLTEERLETVGEIWESQIAHYQKLNGRSVTHTLAQMLLLAGDQIANVINTIALLLLVCVICIHGAGTIKKVTPMAFFVVAAALFIVTPAFGQSFLWTTGAANYLYGILIVLLALLPYRLQVERADAPKGTQAKEIAKAIAMMLSGMIAGWTNENTAVAMVVIIAGFIVFRLIKKKPICMWNITGLMGGITGCLLMLLSPGTSTRLQNAGGSGGVMAWCRRAAFYSCDLVINLKVLLIMLAVLVAVYIYRKKDVKLSKKSVLLMLEETALPIIYAIGFLASVYSMIVSPQFPKRAWSGPTVLLIIVVLLMYSVVANEARAFIIGRRTAVLLLVMISLPTYVYALLELKNIDAAYRERISIIQTAKEEKEKCAVLPKICGWSGYSCYESVGDLNEDSAEWPNTAIARYYGLEEIICDE